MRKIFLTVFLATSVVDLFAQGTATSPNDLVFDEKEDTSEIVTLKDIITRQSLVRQGQQNASHIKSVWGRQVHFNVSMNNATLETNNQINSEGIANQTYKSDWGVGIQWGETFKLHKKPITGMIMFGIDFDWMDLNVNHFKADSEDYKYNSAEPYRTDVSTNDPIFYYPWGLEKYEVNYGMSIGPSISVAPFQKVGKKWLDYFKINMYYHIGYAASLIYSDKFKDLDMNFNPNPTDPDYENLFYLKSRMEGPIRAQWGSSMFTEFGVELSWKFIGIGYSAYSSTVKYKPIDTDNFDNGKTEFKNKNNRIYLTFKF